MAKKITRIGVGGPVGSGKTAIVEAITPRLLEMGIKVLHTGLGGDEIFFGYTLWNELVESLLQGASLEQAARLHREGISHPGAAGLRLSPAFDERLYRWEQEYFVERCLGAYFGFGRDGRATLLEMPMLREIAAGLAGRARVLVHRDFQSQNLIVRDGAAHLIDVQGMREGLGE